MTDSPSIYIVDDNKEWRDSLSYLFESVGITTISYSSAAEFLDDYHPGDYACLILDIRMPGMSGLELQRELISRNEHLYIIFVTGHANVPAAVRAMLDGAVDFFEKPVDEHALLERVQGVLRDIEAQRNNDESTSHLKQCLDYLTPRETEVVKLLLLGSSTRDIASQLNVSVRTVETYRAKILAKTGYSSTIDLLLKIKGKDIII